MRKLLRSTLPAVLSAALATASVTATPARAELSSFEKFAIGAGAMIVIGSAISSANKAHAAPRVVVTPPRAPVVVLPARCRTVWVKAGHRTRVLASNCLSRRGVIVRHLPRACRVIVPGHGTSFIASCLHRHGYRIG